MKKYTKQRLFEMMQKVNPDFIANENETPELQQANSEIFTPVELEVLNAMAWYLDFNQRNAHAGLHSQLSYDMVYDYNQKHGNIIRVPLTNYTKDELIQYILEFIFTLYTIKKTKALDDNQLLPHLQKLNYEELAKFVDDEYQEYMKNVHELLGNASGGRNLSSDVINRVFDERKRQYDYIMRELQRTYKYINAQSVSAGEINFLELYPIAEPPGTNMGEAKFTPIQVVEAAKSLVKKNAIIVIPFTEEEKSEMDKVYKRSMDYLTNNWGYGKEGYAHVIYLKNPHDIMEMYNDFQTTNFKFNKQILEDLFVTALEGGSNYWAAFDLKDIAPKNVDPRPVSEKVMDAVWTYKKSIPVYDIETGDIDLTSPWVRVSAKEYNDRTEDFFAKHGFEKVGELNLKGVFKALEMLKTDERYSHFLRNIATENYDANDADVFFQLAIMGEIVYG